MKRIVLTFTALAAAALTGGCATTGYASEGSGGMVVSIGAFNDSLSPYGDWVEIGSYGRVWRPNAAVVGVGFRPYHTAGHWVYTDYGWSWESDYDWGWATFHYGRWMLDPAYGWVWVPGTEWAPAWVDWRFGGGYAGWAPLAPVGYVWVNSYQPYYFVESGHMCEHNLSVYVAPPTVYRTAWSVTAPITTTVNIGSRPVVFGPPAAQISTAIGRPIQPVSIAPPARGVIAPHQISGIPANQVHGQVSNIHGIGGGAGFTRPIAQPWNPHPVPNGNAFGHLPREPNNPTAPENPAYRGNGFGQNPNAANAGYRANGFGQNPGMQQNYRANGYGQNPGMQQNPGYRSNGYGQQPMQNPGYRAGGMQQGPGYRQPGQFNNPGMAAPHGGGAMMRPQQAPAFHAAPAPHPSGGMRRR